ncbi:hypothetical protein Tco_1282561 [Tanacetum coccineum]
MMTLKFVDTHNMVASKPTESDGFEQMVDFLNAHSIRHALTINPTIYISCIEQFWSTVKAKTINAEVQLHALVDGKKIIITESIVRRDLQLEDAKGVDCLPNSTIFEQLTLMGLKTTAWNRFSSTMASEIICLATNQKFNFSKYIFESMIKNLDNVSGKFLMYPSENVADEAVHKELGDSLVRATNTASSLEVEQDSGNITKTRSKATPNESSSLGTTSGGGPSDEDSLKLNELMELCTTLQKKVLDLEKTDTQANADYQFEKVVSSGEWKKIWVEMDASKQVSTAATTITITTKEITLAQALEALKTSKPKVKGYNDEEIVKPIKKKVQIMLHKEVALKLQAKFHEEERLAREKAKKEKEANIALIKEWDDIQAKIDADHQLAKRRKHFAAKRAEEQRNKPPTQAQQRKIICTYLKNMEGYKLKDLKSKGFDSIQEMFDRAFKKVQKKQKVDDDKEIAELKQCMEIIPDEEEVTIDAIPLAVKPLRIVDWKIHKKGKKSYYQIIRVDGKSQMYRIFSQMIKSFNREDLEDLYKLVKARYGSTRPVESMDYLLLNDMKIMFEPHVEDEVWKLQNGYKVLEWKLYDSCGVNFLRMQSMQIYMLVAKKYPLTPPTLSMMLEKKLQIDYESEMAYQLCKLILKQLKKSPSKDSTSNDPTPPNEHHCGSAGPHIHGLTAHVSSEALPEPQHIVLNFDTHDQ